MLVLVLQNVIVALQITSDTRHIGDDGRQLSKVETVHADGEVLAHRRVLVLGVQLQTGLVVGDEVNLRLHLTASVEEDIVVFVQIELLVADGRTLWHQSQPYAVLFHLRCRAESYA